MLSIVHGVVLDNFSPFSAHLPRQSVKVMHMKIEMLCGLAIFNVSKQTEKCTDYIPIHQIFSNISILVK